ncbi:hypothetical protein BDP27DRAFT_1363309 [Rhodocollybia butyracea]|uniref:NAD(P)-binding protein n=1 Tax=Rhodocollybia butyracea TaxID=206335 RepID=A0A9P5U8Z4_9AGAR|nr:hypothetical protein BDP27DRAFT_1363309 [Rhodocollybia butyracea]
MSDKKGFAFITGSSQGIGKAIALRLAADGFDIALNDLPSKLEQLKDVEKEIQALQRKTGIFVGDVSNEDSVKSVIESAVKQLGSLDVCVANAGVFTNRSILDTPAEEWDRVFAINARGPFLCYKYAAIQMVSQGRGGRIIGACSLSGRRGRRGGVSYCGTKFAVRGMTQSAALDLAQYGITVNAYAPINDVIGDDHDGSKHKEYIQSIPLGRAAEPSDISNLVSFIASKESSYITGQMFDVNGGAFLN